MLLQRVPEGAGHALAVSGHEAPGGMAGVWLAFYDVRGAQLLGIRGVLVRTGKFLPEDLAKVPEQPDHVLETIADLPDLLGRSR